MNVSVQKGGANPYTITVSYNGGGETGDIDRINVAVQTSDSGLYEGVLKLQPGDSLQFNGTARPDRVAAWARMKDGSSRKLFDRDY